MHALELPNFKDLPIIKGTSLRSSWGLFDKNGERDQLGCLNLLTPDVVLDATKEIRTGIRVSLNWALNHVAQPGFKRKSTEHKIIDNAPLCGHDDELHINTQSGSQWDGFRHWGHQELRLYYNGLKHEEISGPNPLPINGLDQWHKHGCVAGRSVLIDYSSWAERNGISYSPMEKNCISVQDLEHIAQEQGITFKPGDILLVRSGMVKWYNTQTPKVRNEATHNGHAFTGVEGSPETIEWLWNHHFAAIVGDAIGFEAWPANPEWRIHDWCLALLGMPIGELWDLEALAVECNRQKKWTFFLTSSPLNVEGGVASPPNALAIL